MRLQPKRTKFRKQRKGSRKGIINSDIVLGSVGLRCIERGRINAREIESARRTIRHHLNRDGRLQVKVFPDVPVSKKPREVRMGKGKGAVEQQGAKVRPGIILFEVGGVTLAEAVKALHFGGKKLSVSTNIKHRRS